MSAEFKTYVATTKFSVSREDDPTKSIPFSKGKIVKFDGETAIVGGKSYALERLSMALNANWLIEVEGGQDAGDVDYHYQRPSANINLRGATPQQQDTVFSGATQMSEEERVVSQVSERSDAMQRSFEGEAFEPTSRASVAKRQMEIISDGTSGGKVLNTRFKTSAKNKNDLSSMREQDLRKISHIANDMVGDVHGDVPAEVGGSVRTAEGITFRNEGVGEHAAAGVTSARHVGVTNMPISSEAGQVVGSYKNLTEQRMSQPSQQGSFFTQEAQTEPEEPVIQTISYTEGFNIDSAAFEVEPDDTLDPKTKEGRYAVAKIIHPNLPDWDFQAHWTKKMAALKDEITDEVAIRAIYASESEAIKKRIVKELGLRV